jgi:hypothetical protein
MLEGNVWSATKSWQNACWPYMLCDLREKPFPEISFRFCMFAFGSGGASVPADGALPVRLDRRWNTVAEEKERLRKVPSKR